jgi:phage baseplate assembly protein W
MYSDLDLRFDSNPVTGDVNILSDITAVKRSIVHLILTRYGERPFMDQYGSSLARQLFENEEVDVLSIKNNIIRTIQRNEKRVTKVQDVLVSTGNDDNTLRVQIHFLVSSVSQEQQIIELKLKRNR